METLSLIYVSCISISFVWQSIAICCMWDIKKMPYYGVGEDIDWTTPHYYNNEDERLHLRKLAAIYTLLAPIRLILSPCFALYYIFAGIFFLIKTASWKKANNE
jgi:hypothetical protein